MLIDDEDLIATVTALATESLENHKEKLLTSEIKQSIDNKSDQFKNRIFSGDERLCTNRIVRANEHTSKPKQQTHKASRQASIAKEVEKENKYKMMEENVR